MAFVSVPKDLSKVKTKIALNLTKRQIISFSIGGVVGLPVYWHAKVPLGSDIAVFLMIGCILPFFFAGIFEKDGIVFEKYIGYIIKHKFIYSKIRLYKTENFYEYLNNGDEREVASEKSKTNKSRKTTQKKSKGFKP